MVRGEKEGDFIFEVLSVDIDWSMDFENLMLDCRARIKVRIENKIKFSYATSKDGQINAFDLALRKVISEFYPEINEITLKDYKVELVADREGVSTDAYVKVVIRMEWGDGRQTQVEAIGSDLVAASIEALSSAYNFALKDIISHKETILV